MTDTAEQVSASTPQTAGVQAAPPQFVRLVEAKPPNPEVAEVPTQAGPEGLRYDFCDGCRVLLPTREEPWRVRITEVETGIVHRDVTEATGLVTSEKRYYVGFRLEVWLGERLVFTHELDPRHREVLIRFPVETLGDTVGWLPYAIKFQQLHDCRLTCSINRYLIPLFRDAYPEITFLPPEAVELDRFYAAYKVVVFFVNDLIFDYKDRVPCDFRFVGLHRAAGYVLGVDPSEVPPRVVLPDESRPIAERYVCLAVQSTMAAKYWNNPTGWRDVVAFLKEAGYRVFCIDQKAIHGQGNFQTQAPAGAEDLTGDRPLAERARWLRHADFFVGLSSGLSWLAWACGTPVVMISGFTHPRNEFGTPYRVINYHVCNSCWNDPRAAFNRHDFLSCPRHQNTPRHFECTRLITAEHVKAVIRTIPGFPARAHAPG
jgi:autotransporter strand-loop-strand O-heptosyltransferase